MKRQILILGVIVALLLACATELAHSGEADPSSTYIVEQGSSAGGDYALSSVGWQVKGTVSGGGYQLLDPLSTNGFPPPSAEVGCCCTYTPCILKNVH
jgi:hypothetical protein